jgi:hypothetical protein
MRRLLYILLLAPLAGMAQRTPDIPDGMLQELRSNPVFDKVYTNRDAYRFELIVSFIDRKPNGKTRLRTYTTGDDGRYYYPASTIKLPLAIAVLAQFNPDTRDRDIEYWPAQVCGNTYARKTIQELVTKMLVYSDNVAYNMLYDLVGRRAINNTLRQLDIKDSRISRRLMWCSDSAHAVHPAVRLDGWDRGFREPADGRIRKDKARFSDAAVGVKHLMGGDWRQGPRDFGDHNYLRLADLHNLVAAIATERNPGRILSSDDWTFIKRLMCATPDKFGDRKTYPGVTKYLLFGENSKLDFNRYLSFNIVGMAYGFMVESTYLCDLATGQEVVISLRGYFNANNVLGDDVYEYHREGYPLFEWVGRLLLEKAVNRNRQDIDAWRSPLTAVLSTDS